MGLSKDQLANIIGRASKLCGPEGDAKVSAHIDQSGFSRPVNEGYDPDPSDYDGDASDWDSLYSDSASDYSSSSSPDINYSQSSFARSAMPENIKKSLMENPIDRSALSSSITAGMNIKPQRKTTASMQQKAVISEGRQQYAPSAGGVDYSIIKAIVSECIREYFSNNVLNESTISQIHLKGGTISLVDNKGDVFRAKLEKIGNTKDQ